MIPITKQFCCELGIEIPLFNFCVGVFRIQPTHDLYDSSYKITGISRAHLKYTAKRETSIDLYNNESKNDIDFTSLRSVLVKSQLYDIFCILIGRQCKIAFARR